MSEQPTAAKRQAISSEAAILASYEAAGLDPVYADPERTMLVSLEMLLHNGWRVEEINGRAVLTR